MDTWIGKIPWKRTWQPTPVFLPRESRGQRSLVGYSPWGRTESTGLKRLSSSSSSSRQEEPRRKRLEFPPVTKIANKIQDFLHGRVTVIHCLPLHNKGLPGGSDSKDSSCKEGDLGSIPGSGRSPGEGNGNPLQYSCLENPMDRGAWWATVHGVPKSRT